MVGLSKWALLGAAVVFISLISEITGSSPANMGQICGSNKVRQAKCDCAMSLNPNTNCGALSPCFGGNQILSEPAVSVIESYCSRVKAAKFSGKRKRAIYNFDTSPEKKWALPIQYMIDSNIASSAYRATIRGALSHIQDQTCIRFTEITQPGGTTTPYIQYSMADGCSSFIGRSTDFQYTQIFGNDQCLGKFGEMLYYTVQTLGTWHESQRPDADLYVTVNLSNVDSLHQGDFSPVPAQLQQTYGYPYGYASIMHFPGRIYSQNGGITLRTLDPLYQNTIGQRVQLAFLDSKTLNTAYCSAACSGVTLTASCQNGGYQDPKNCAVCRCPDGYTGSACTVVESTVGEDVCGGRVPVTDVEQLITSPGYGAPGYYTEGVGCTWQLVASSGRNIEISFEDEFGLHCENFACYHWVEVRYKGQLNNTGPRFCCNTLPTAVLTSEGSEMLIVFRSNQTGLPTTERRGFKIVFRLVPDTSCSCRNGGTCVNGICICPAPFTGVSCETTTVPACQDVLCLNGGTCRDGTCICQPGYTGTNCQTVTGGTGCIRECRNGGSCVNGTCVCPAGYTGSSCETPVANPCQGVICLNGGSCQNGICVCPPNYTGTNCQTVTGGTGCQVECANGGSCVNRQCVCRTGFTGASCETTLPPSGCNPNPCNNNGTCSITSAGKVNCDCPNPFYGTLCEKANCGGCLGKPGLLQSKCKVQTVPLRQCNYTVTDTDWDCWCWVFNCKKVSKTRVVYYTCYTESCCDNAAEYNSACGVTGWGDWSSCSVSCGGGTKIRYYYDYVPRTDGSGKSTLAAVRNETSEACNTQTCECDDMDIKRCSFTYKDGKCQVPGPFENLGPYCYDQSRCRRGNKKKHWWSWG